MNPFFAIAVIAIGVAGLGGCDTDGANEALASLTDTEPRSSERNTEESRAKTKRAVRGSGLVSPAGPDYHQASSCEPTVQPDVPVL